MILIAKNRSKRRNIFLIAACKMLGVCQDMALNLRSAAKLYNSVVSLI
jgi:hypothetical protein